MTCPHLLCLLVLSRRQSTRVTSSLPQSSCSTLQVTAFTHTPGGTSDANCRKDMQKRPGLEEEGLGSRPSCFLSSCVCKAVTSS